MLAHPRQRLANLALTMAAGERHITETGTVRRHASLPKQALNDRKSKASPRRFKTPRTIPNRLTINRKLEENKT